MNRVNEMDPVVIDGIHCCSGHPLSFGASLPSNGGISFSIDSADTEGCAMQFRHPGDAETYTDNRISGKARFGNNDSIIVFDQNREDLECACRFCGVMNPERGHRFEPYVFLPVPYAKLISGREGWRESGDSQETGDLLR